jgi:hypothetical protein
MATDKERNVIYDYLLTFAPWIAYITCTEAANSWRLGYIVGLAISIALVAWRTIRRDSRFIDVGTLCFCAIMVAVSLTFPHSPLKTYDMPLSLVAVGLLSFFSLAVRSPFTYRIARDKVPAWILKDSVQHARLFRAHVVATRSWATAQTAGGALGAILIDARIAPAAVAAQTIGTLLPVAVTRIQHEHFLSSVFARRDEPDKPCATTDSDSASQGDQQPGLHQQESTPAGTELSAQRS